jgi:hypothetical protein
MSGCSSGVHTGMTGSEFHVAHVSAPCCQSPAPQASDGAARLWTRITIDIETKVGQLLQNGRDT